MTENTQTKSTQQAEDLQLIEYGSRDDVAALSRRIRSMMPGGDKLTPAQAMAAAQYAILVDANPFRGEIYAYPDKRSQLVLMDGYKLLVRWAKKQCPYSERYTRLPDLSEGDIGYRCWILRNDARATLHDLVQAGATFQEAFEIAATSAVGVVRKHETWSAKYKKPINPPKGWTWDQVAEKRALKNALNRSHGAPSPREIARESWMVGQTETITSDWQECTPEMSQAARERLAAITAQDRIREPDDRTPAEILAENGKLLHEEQEVLI